MITVEGFERVLDEACTCGDPFAEYKPGCEAHAVHLLIDARLDLANPSATLARALHDLAELHFRHDPPGPVPSDSGSCGACGGTGEVFRGWAMEGGPIFDGECGCDTPYCGGCGKAWPCGDMLIIARAVGLDRPDFEAAILAAPANARA